MNSSAEMISKLMAENVILKERSVMLDRLLFEVGTKYPNENRYETALRYIQTMENKKSESTGAEKEASE